MARFKGRCAVFEQEITEQQSIEVPEDQPLGAAGGAEKHIDIRTPPAVFAM
jgi:hypothetical protein